MLLIDYLCFLPDLPAYITNQFLREKQEKLYRTPEGLKNINHFCSWCAQFNLAPPSILIHSNHFWSSLISSSMQPNVDVCSKQIDTDRLKAVLPTGNSRCSAQSLDVTDCAKVDLCCAVIERLTWRKCDSAETLTGLFRSVAESSLQL